MVQRPLSNKSTSVKQLPDIRPLWTKNLSLEAFPVQKYFRPLKPWKLARFSVVPNKLHDSKTFQ